MEDKNSKDRITIGYLLPFMWGDLSLSLTSGVHKKSTQLDINLICIVGQRLNDTSREFTKQANVVYDLVDSEYIKGIVIWGSQITKGLSKQEAQAFYDKFKNIPIIGLLNSIEADMSIVADDNEGINSIMEHLVLDHGYKKIGFIRGNKDNNAMETRFNAYKESLEQFGLPYKSKLVSNYNEVSIEGGKKGTRQLFEKRKLEPVQDIEAIIAPSDILAIGVAEQLRQLGIRCPEDIAIVGFENSNKSKMCKPSLTSVDLSINQQGDKAVSLLIDTLNNNLKLENMTVTERLIIRNSCGCKEISLSDVNIKDYNNKFEITQIQQQEAVKNIQKKIISLYYTIDSSWIENMVSNFIYDLKNSTERFLSALNIYLDIICSQNEDVSNFENVITLIKNEFLPLIKNSKTLVKANDILNRAKITIADTADAVLFDKLTKNENTFISIYSSEQMLMATFNLKEFLDTIETIIKEVNITSCYIAIYDKQEDLLNKSKLIFAYNETGRIMIAKDYYFNPKEIVPKELRPTDRRYTYVVNALYYKNIQLGFVVYETDILDRFIFDTLSGQISNSLYRIRIFERLRQIEKEKEALYKKLQIKNSELESKILERTSAIHNVNKELQNAITKINHANAAKNKLLVNINNEIRTPLNCIIGFSEILQTMEVQSYEYKEYISLISQESEKLFELLDRICDVSKMETGKLILNKDVFDIHNCIETTISSHSLMAEKKGLYYHVYGLNIIPKLLIGDALRLKQILSNLIANAIKFTQKGGITVSLEIAEETKDKIEILFNVNDTGIGITKDKHSSIFENFIPDDITNSENKKIGISLAISKQLVELMEGTMGVDSIENEGSTFWFTARFDKVSNSYIGSIKKSHKSKNPEIPVSNLSTSTILLVEDYPTNKELIKVYLKNTGCKLIEAEDEKTAMKLYENNFIDLVLLDMQLCGIDSYNIAKTMKQKKKGQFIPIIALTNNIFENNTDYHNNSVIDDIIGKPFRQYNFKYKTILWLNKAKNLANFIEGEEIVSLKPEVENEFNKTTYVDIDKNIRELDGDTKYFIKISTEFLNEAQNQLIKIKSDLNSKNYGNILIAIAILKQKANALTMLPLLELINILENKIQTSDFSDMDILIKTIEMTIIKTEVYLKTKLS